jgi:hypothetical protein
MAHGGHDFILLIAIAKKAKTLQWKKLLIAGMAPD